MPITVEGVYEDGRIELAETPQGIQKSRVTVTFWQEPDERQRVDELRQRFLARLRRGVDFGSEPLPNREELYANRIDRFGNGIR